MHVHVRARARVCVCVWTTEKPLPYNRWRTEKPLPRATGLSPDKVTAPTIVRVSVTSFAIRATVPSASDE